MEENYKKRIIDILQKGTFSISKITVKSAINPMLWIIGTTTPICLIIAAVVQSLRLVFLIIGLIPLLLGCFAYFYCLFRLPDYLRSEDYLIRRMTLELFGEKGQEITEAEIRKLNLMSKAMLPPSSKHEDQ